MFKVYLEFYKEAHEMEYGNSVTVNELSPAVLVVFECLVRGEEYPPQLKHYEKLLTISLGKIVLMRGDIEYILA